MAVRYNKLFHMMIDRGMTNTKLRDITGFSANIITRLKKDEYISLESIEKICEALNCNVDDILEFVSVSGSRTNKASQWNDAEEGHSHGR